jgi:hypothetical protein
MKFVKSIGPIVGLVCLAIIGTACKGAGAGGVQSTPTLAYKALYEAVKRKDTEGIKRAISKGTIEMMQSYAQLQKKPFEQVIENGMTETTLPETRNEKIWGDVAILEVKNMKSGSWESLPFVKEDGVWKLAIDTFFRGTMSPNGPTNPEHPGELPPGAQPGPPQARPPGAKQLPREVPPADNTQPGAPNPVPPAPSPTTSPGKKP